MTIKTAILHKGKDAPLRRRHPWVFSGAIRRWEGSPRDGEVVAVRSAAGELLGTGHFQDGSIQVRVFAFEQVEVNTDFWTAKLKNALELRHRLGLPQSGQTDCYRLIHGEGDGLPGLIIDVYGRTAALQCHSIGMHLHRHELTEALHRTLGDDLLAVYDKSADSLPSAYGATVTPGYLSGHNEPAPVLENGHAFEVDWEGGQKTGFFLDQRDNRHLLAQYAAGQTVLNAFSYTGGFSVYALAAGAKLVHSVDISGKAVEAALRNAALTGAPADRHEGIVSDVLKYLQTSEDGLYDIMVVDPPAFAKSNDKRHNAIQAYKRLNELAMRKIKPGGLLFTFSCSQVVDRTMFYNTMVAAAIEAGRAVRVLHHLRQPADHPVSLFHPEGEYLKGLVLEVE